MTFIWVKDHAGIKGDDQSDIFKATVFAEIKNSHSIKHLINLSKKQGIKIWEAY